jgi:hypothetical protein
MANGCNRSPASAALFRRLTSARSANNPSIPGACAQRRLGVREHAAERLTRHAGLPIAAQLARQPHLARSARHEAVRFSADAVYSLNLHQQSLVDVNFAPINADPSRGINRPLYVLPSSIVPATGDDLSRLSHIVRFGSVNAINSI